VTRDVSSAPSDDDLGSRIWNPRHVSDFSSVTVSFTHKRKYRNDAACGDGEFKVLVFPYDQEAVPWMTAGRSHKTAPLAELSAVFALYVPPKTLATAYCHVAHAAA
jgi:hypothetical protein